MTFTIQRLVNNRAVVRGSDIHGGTGTCVLDTTQWDDINARKAFSQAGEEFDAAVKEFFAPLEAAAEKVGKTLERPEDSVSYVVFSEPVEGQPAKRGDLVKLTHDSIVLRLIEQDSTAPRLLWVSDTQLEVAEANGTGSVGAVVSTPPVPDAGIAGVGEQQLISVDG